MNTNELVEEVARSNGHGAAAEAPAPAHAGPAPKKRPWALLALAAVLAIGGASVPLVRNAYSHESTDDAFIDGHIVSVSPRVAGQVLAVRVHDNELVAAGQPLVEIDGHDYQAKVTEERGKLAAAQADARRAIADVQRYQTIYRQDEISKQQLDHAQAEADMALANVEKEKGVVEQAELNASYTRITAPQAGRITRKAVEAGSYVQAGQALFSIVPDEIWVTANFKETQLTHLRPGQKVAIRVDAYPQRRLEGHVESLQSGTGERFSLLPPENATGNYVKVVQRVPVKIVLDSPKDEVAGLAPGMSVVPTVTVR